MTDRNSPESAEAEAARLARAALEVRIAQEVAAGVARRDIAWRAAAVLAVPRRSPLPRWVDPLLVILICGYLLAGIGAAPFAAEEGNQLALSRDAQALLTDPAELLPGGDASTTTERLRLVHGSLTRYAVAAGWYAAGGRGAERPAVPGVPGPALAAPARPPWRLVIAARVGPAALAVFGALGLFLLARRIAGRRAAAVAVLLYGLHPLVLLTGRRAVDAGIVQMFGLAAVLVAAGAAAELARGAPTMLGSWFGMGVFSGLTLAAGPGGLPFVLGALAWTLAGLVAVSAAHRKALLTGRVVPPEQPRPGDAAALIVVATLTAVLAWVAVSPALWGWLPERLAARHQARQALVAERLLPDPGPGGASARLHAIPDLAAAPFLAGAAPAQARDGGLGRPAPPAQTARYLQSWWSGSPLGVPGAMPVGLLLSAAAGLGVVGAVRQARGLPLGSGRTAIADRIRPAVTDVVTAAAAGGTFLPPGPARRPIPVRWNALALLGWTGTTAAWFVAAPSVQPVHRLPVIAVACLLAATPVLSTVEYAVRGVRVLLRGAIRRRVERGGLLPPDSTVLS